MNKWVSKNRFKNGKVGRIELPYPDDYERVCSDIAEQTGKDYSDIENAFFDSHTSFCDYIADCYNDTWELVDNLNDAIESYFEDFEEDFKREQIEN